ncbi:MAG: GNAT family N-acetyltransferase [Chitinispirillaceae bacterium]
MTAWKDIYTSKVMSASAAVKLIKSGARIFIGSGCAQPQTIIKEMVNTENDILDAEVYTYFPVGPARYADEQYGKKFRVCSFFLSPSIREAVNQGRGDYLPVSLSEIPELFKSGRIPIHTVIVQTSPPDKNGNLSLGFSVDIAKAAVENSLTVIAEVNESMPRTMGDSFIPVEMVDAIVESDKPVLEHRLDEGCDVCDSIAKNVASLVEDGATLELGNGNVPHSVLKYLTDKKDIGIHSEIITDSIIPLIESGVINGRRKGLNKGKIVTSTCVGSRKLYDYVNENSVFEFRPSEYVNDPFVISQNFKMTSINTAVEVDMTGQVCSDSKGYSFESGVGGVVDFARGTAKSKGGKSIIALRATSDDGRKSNIVAHLAEGAGTVIPRSSVDYVVTEFGIARLSGKNVRERVIALAEIAHPDFRNDILKAAKEHNYVYPYQKEMPAGGTQYPREYETVRTLADGTKLFFRPIRPSDTKSLRDMFYALSEQSIAFRFFEPFKTFPHKFIQDFTTIDFSKDMAIAAIIKDLGGEQIVGVGHYYTTETIKKANVSFVVRDDWQAKGIGTLLLEILTDIARQRGLVGFEGKVLEKNELMLGVFYNSGYKITTKKLDDSYLISFGFKKE